MCEKFGAIQRITHDPLFFRVDLNCIGADFFIRLPDLSTPAPWTKKFCMLEQDCLSWILELVMLRLA